MAVPSSGQLRLRADIALEVDGSATGDNVSLGTLADTAGFDTPPDTMQEFYGYTACTAPSVTTNSSDNISINSMRLNGNVTNDNGCSVTSRGFYFGTSSNYANNGKYTVGSGTGSYNTTRGGLSSSTTYYSTAWAINSEGETRGSTISASTTTPITYTGYSTNNQPNAWAEIGNFAVQYYNNYGYGQYLHSQLGWQTDNSCANGTFSAGTSGSNPSSLCGYGKTVGFHPDYRAGSTLANSRGTLNGSGRGLSFACCADNYTVASSSYLSQLYGYSSFSVSGSSGPAPAYSFIFDGNQTYSNSGCPTSSGCDQDISYNYTSTISR